MHAKVGIDTNQMRIESCVVDLRKWNSVCDHGLTKPLISIGHDVRRVEK